VRAAAGVVAPGALGALLAAVCGVLPRPAGGDHQILGHRLDQATEWKSVAKAAGFALAVLLILEYVHIIPASRWMEDHLDTLSVHATLFTGRRTTWWLRIRTHLRFHSRVTT
jgi:hypothetical protein